MDPILKNIEPFRVRGIQIRTKNVDEFDPSTAQIPALWKRFPSEVFEILAPASQGIHPEPFGFYLNYEFDANGSYSVLAGAKANSTTSDRQGALQIQGGAYLVFSAHGEIPRALIECWGGIWAYFSNPTFVSKLLSAPWLLLGRRSLKRLFSSR